MMVYSYSTIKSCVWRATCDVRRCCIYDKNGLVGGYFSSDLDTVVVTTAFSHWTHDTNKSIDTRLLPPTSHSATEWEIRMMCMGDDSILRCNRYRHNCTVWSSSYILRLCDTWCGTCTTMIQSNMRRALVPATSILVEWTTQTWNLAHHPSSVIRHPSSCILNIQHPAVASS